MDTPKNSSSAGEGSLPLPRYLAETASQNNSDEWRAWLNGLPQMVADLSARWSLRLDPPYDPGGVCSWVAPARGADGADLVLKVGWRHPEAEYEVDGLRFWDGDGAVRLYDAYTTGDTCALLLERCTPGLSLGRTLPEPEQDVVIAGLLRRLWQEPPAGHPFRPLQAMCDQWRAEFERKAEQVAQKMDRGLVQAGLEIFRAYAGTADRHLLLCTDLHAENVLAATREPWLVIDPKPHVGDPAYDAVQHMLNCLERVEADPHGLCRRMSGLLGVDSERVTTWLFARCVQESCGDDPWSRRLGAIAQRVAP